MPGDLASMFLAGLMVVTGFFMLNSGGVAARLIAMALSVDVFLMVPFPGPVMKKAPGGARESTVTG